MAIKYEYMPPQMIALQAEMASGYHPALTQAMGEPENRDLDLADKLGVICTYCGIAIDATLSDEGTLKLCDMLVERLQQIRVNPLGLIVVKELPK